MLMLLCSASDGLPEFKVEVKNDRSGFMLTQEVTVTVVSGQSSVSLTVNNWLAKNGKVQVCRL